MENIDNSIVVSIIKTMNIRKESITIISDLIFILGLKNNIPAINKF